MSNEYRAKVFKSGNSVALRLPKALGIAEGAEMVVREDRGKFEFEPVQPAKRKFDVAKVRGSAVDLEPVDHDRSFEARSLHWAQIPPIDGAV